MSVDFAEPFQVRLRGELKDAMRARNKPVVQTLRSLIAAIDNAQAVDVGSLHDTYVEREFADGGAEVPRKILSQQDVFDILQQERSSRLEDADALLDVGQDDRALALREEAEIIERYLTS